MKLKNFFAVLLGFSILAVACNQGDTASGDRTSDSGQASTGENNNQNSSDSTSGTNMSSDAQFVSDMVAGNIAEIKLARLAQEKATTKDVKDLANMLEQDHTAVLGQLRDYASKKNITVPAEEKPDAKSKYDEFAKKSGKEFDKDWCSLMETKHKEGIKKFEDISNSASTEPELKTLATNTLPKLRTHLDHVMQCQNKLK